MEAFFEILPIPEMVTPVPIPSDRIQTSTESFRDPSGFLYFKGKTLLRQVNHRYRDNYECLMNSGLYRRLTQAGCLVTHEEMRLDEAASAEAYRVLRPQWIPFISYPYEWSFRQLQDAALLTLKIQKESLGFEMSLKDASAYNIQFWKGQPVLVDTLSFERYQEGKPWIAYRQFCQHFLGPLALMSYTDARLSQLLRIHLDGIPLDLVSSLLPARSFARLSLFIHLYLHSKTQRHFANRPSVRKPQEVSRHAALGLVDNLESAVRRLKWRPPPSEWSDYYAGTNYGSEAFRFKQQQVHDILRALDPRPRILWDLGANTGEFSRLASALGILTIAFDADPVCVEKNYLECKARQEPHLLPLLQDLTNPSSALGWESLERKSLISRGPADAVLALALIHHLALSNNLPLSRIAAFFGGICRFLVIEFVPKGDSQVSRLLASREDIFPNYDQANFEREFMQYFKIRNSTPIPGTMRTLYWMEKSGE
ncbi:MAG: SAM-dependent methyltransferase [Terriglobia bacterium]